MPFRNHVFISYTHENNKPAEDGGLGWVDQFEKALIRFLGCKYRGAKIWRDKSGLRGNDAFSNEIFAQFPDTALLVSVISPSYLESGWCLDEVKKFCEIAKRPPGLFVDNKMRIFKVVLDPEVNRSPLLPAPLPDQIGFEFFSQEDGWVRELDPTCGDDMRGKFNAAVQRLACEVAPLLKKLDSARTMTAAAGSATGADGALSAAATAHVAGVAAGANITAAVAAGIGTDAAAAPTGPVVYLAECGYDRREDRKALMAELRARNIRVLPERELPRDEDEYRTEVARLLEQSVLSVHLVGSVPGFVPDGPDPRTAVMIQNELAVARARGATLKRVISLPAEMRSDDAKQQAFIEAVHRDPDVQFKAEVITASIEAVKTAILTALAPPAPAPAAAEPGDNGSVYVIFDARDRKDEGLMGLRKRMRAGGLTLCNPVFDGDPQDVRTIHEGHLAECDAVLIYYGVGTEAWKQSIDRDVAKAKGRRGGRKLRAVFNWIAAPTSDDKEFIIEESADDAAANLIDARGGVSQSVIDEKIVAVALGGRP